MDRRDAVKLAASGLVLQAGQSSARAADPPTPGGFDVKSFGAKGDGKTLDTAAINKTIDAAAAAGGGTVILSAGTYASYSIHLKSKVSLYLGPGATILAADPPPPTGTGGYDDAEPMELDKYQDYGHSHFHNSLIWGEGLEDIGILGPGMIYGKGLSKGTGPGLRAEDPHVGNKAISLKNCRNVVLRDFAILQGGHFGILATGVDNFTIDNLRIDTNRDGMDIDCCRNVRVSNCTVNSPWDDAICLKSSFGLGHARSTDMVTITNCMVSGSFALGSLMDGTFKPMPTAERIPRTGRIKFGTESNGGFKNVTITNCVFDGCQGLALETVDGAVIEDVCISNITMRNILAAPIFLRLGSRMRGPANVPVGAIRRVIISNITCLNAPAPRICSIIAGIPGHAIEDLKLSEITILHQGGGDSHDASIQLAEKEKDYPEPTMFGTTPAHGFFIRHVKGIEVSGVKIESTNNDARPAFVLDGVRNADFRNITLPSAGRLPVFALNDVKGLSISRSKPVPDTELETVDHKELP